METAIDLLNESAEEIDLAKIENDLSESRSGVYFLSCKPKDTYSARARRSFKNNVLDLEKRALLAAVEGQQVAADLTMATRGSPPNPRILIKLGHGAHLASL